jgi:hypothetical protein
MPKDIFAGVSNNGNIQEALDNAIAISKETLHTDMIKWSLESISGEDGGFIQIHKLIVTIKAQAGM